MTASIVQKSSAVFLAIALAGCATTPQQFEQRRYSMSDLEVCNAWRDAERSRDPAFIRQTRSEATRRGVSVERCKTLIAERDRAVAGAVAAVAIIGLAVAASRKGGGGGGSYATPYQAQPVDREWDWDLFQNEHGRQVWACRGVQTGQFAETSQCQFRLQTDLRWPGPNAPR